MHQYVVYAKWIALTNCRRSDGTPLDGQHGISRLCDGNSWSCFSALYHEVRYIELVWSYQILHYCQGEYHWASMNKWCFRALLKAGRVGMDKWFGSAFQIFEATYENDLEVAPWWFYMGDHKLTKMKKSRVLAWVCTYRGMRDAR